MTYIDAITALFLFGFFLAGFSQAFLPSCNAWNMAAKEYSIAHTIQFIAESFRNECSKPYPDIESWKKNISGAKGLESYEITELRQNDELRVLKLKFIIAGEHLEIIGLCKP